VLSIGSAPSSIGVAGELPDEAYSGTQKQQLTFQPNAQELHDDRLVAFSEKLASGVYEFDYYVRALIPGKYHLLPSVASELYFPENFGRSEGRYVEITK